jgi:hypothetical protein
MTRGRERGSNHRNTEPLGDVHADPQAHWGDDHHVEIAPALPVSSNALGDERRRDLHNGARESNSTAPPLNPLASGLGVRDAARREPQRQMLEAVTRDEWREPFQRDDSDLMTSGSETQTEGNAWLDVAVRSDGKNVDLHETWPVFAG